MTTKKVKENVDWHDKVREESGTQEASAMSEIPTLKVYNKPMGNTPEDPVKAWKMIIKRGWGDWEIFWEEVKLNILLVRKFYTGFVPRIDEFGDIKRDDNWLAIKDFYYTPEVDVFNKDNIPLWVQRKWAGKEIVWKDSKASFDDYCKQPKVDWAINPLFKEVKTNERTWERYTTSYMRLGYVIYAKDIETDEVYKIIPWGSYGRFNDIKDWTFEHLKLNAKNDYKEVYNNMVLDSFIKTKVWVRSEWGFYYLDWKLDWFVTEDNTELVTEVRDLVDEFNQERFKWVNFDQPLEALPYKSVLALEAWATQKEVAKEEKAVEKIRKQEEINASDVPF